MAVSAYTAKQDTGGKVQGLGDLDRSGGLILEGKRLDARIEDSVTNASLERTIDGASVLTVAVEDPERFLLRGGYFERQSDILLDDLWFRLCALDKQGDTFTATFEDREVALLRRHTKPRKASRADMTRAEFAAMLVHEQPHIRFVCPQLHVQRPIADLRKADLQTIQDARDAQRKRDMSSTAKVTVKGVAASPAQKKIATRIARVAEDEKAGTRATLALIVAAIGESTMGAEPGTYKPNRAGYWGVFQGGSGQNGSARNFTDPHDVEGMARSFLRGGKGFQAGGAIALAKANPGMDVGTIATKVEASGEAGSFYGKYEAEAKKILQEFGGVDPGPGDDDSLTYVQQYEFSRGQPGGSRGEDTWTCILRLASQVHWRCFIVSGVVYFISDYDLIRSRPRMTIGENTPGVDSIDFSLDTSAKKPDNVTIQCRAARWAAPPGTVVVLDEDMGSATGAWIVSNILRPDLSDQETTITLTRPQVPLPEPASTVATRSTDTQDGGVNVDGPTVPGRKAALTDAGHAISPASSPNKVKAMIVAGNEIVGKTYGPGQHAASSSATHPEYDCSSSLAHILLAAGLVTEGTNYVSGTFASMFEEGPGEWVTIYAHGTHVYAKIAGLWWNTHGDGPVSGIGWHPSNASTGGGFRVRHPKGL